MDSTERGPASSGVGALGGPRGHSSVEDTDERLRNLEWALRRRDAIPAAVGFAAERFLGPSDWEASVRDVLDRLGHAAEAGRVDLFELCREGNGKLKAVQRYEWVTGHGGSAPANGATRASTGAVPRSAMTR